MALVDELVLEASAGKGGDGVVRWLHLKGKEYAGPSGGNGGDGGDVYLRAMQDIALLGRYRGDKEFKAGDGVPGGSFGKDGARGEDLYIDIPRGSLVHNVETGEKFELLEEGETRLVLKGGRGGAGNRVFKSSVNRSPKQATKGTRGEEAEFRIELRLIADAGLIGLPNAGKTTLLNALTGTEAKTGAYAFTTLEPNLGALFGFVLADIPGLIEGASDGRGLGAKFLRHIARTKLLLHCISLEGNEQMKDYDTVRTELKQWGKNLVEKPEMVILTKSDSRDAQDIKKISDSFRKKGVSVHVVSALDDEQVKDLRDALTTELRAEAQPKVL